MANDTTRKVDFTREQCGLPPLDSWEAIARELLRWLGHSGTLPDAARHWIVDTVENIPPNDDQAAITSLQRELAEARGERDNLKSAIASHREHSVDCGRTLWRHDRELWDAQSAPAPSDVNGEEPAKMYWDFDKANACIRGIGVALGINEPGTTVFGIGLEILQVIESLKSRASLTPLTDPSVRGVLVKTSSGFLALRPASEFGVPVRGGQELNERIESAVADIHKALGMVGMRTSGQWLDPILDRIAKLKSTPAEPAQKLVPLPEGRFAQLRESDGLWIEFNPALYGVPAERIMALEAEVDLLKQNQVDFELQRKRTMELIERKSEAERLRKAIKRAIYALEACGISGTIEAQQSLLAALAPSPAASGEETNGQRNGLDDVFAVRDVGNSAVVGGGSLRQSVVAASAPAAESEIDQLRKRAEDAEANVRALTEQVRKLEAAASG